MHAGSVQLARVLFATAVLAGSAACDADDSDERSDAGGAGDGDAADSGVDAGSGPACLLEPWAVGGDYGACSDVCDGDAGQCVSASCTEIGTGSVDVGGACSDTEDCKPGLGCWDDGSWCPEGSCGRCQEFCEGPSGQCAAGLQCHFFDVDNPSVGTCMEFQSTCELLDQDDCNTVADPGGCYPHGRGGVASCWVPRALGNVGDACRLPNDCSPGLSCGADCACVQLCDLSADWCDCAAQAGFPEGVGVVADGQCEFAPLEPCGACGDANAGGCGDGQACHCESPSGDPVCAPAGDGSAGTECADDSECAPGFACWHPACGAGSCGNCHAYCAGEDTGMTERRGDDVFPVLAGDCPFRQICLGGHFESATTLGICLP